MIGALFLLYASQGRNPIIRLWLALRMAMMTFVEFFFWYRVMPLPWLPRGFRSWDWLGMPEWLKRFGLVWPAVNITWQPILSSTLQRIYQLKLAMDGPVAFYSRFPADVEEFGIIWSSRQWSKTI
ncbi:uncharacterized protein FMAN_04173 [Fusarium mangiferae]|uniref:Uncharacterized protein n=1 Tax=Fusarium mangiferae TaxID=192010 RepID=A0A1L7SYV7_FUSMA|nr:uncharacterized protein FMAN_04173 [Fusarium mangiferae]CVK89672.1 uncharacterized protein FMAN_04173 [Fusarium mangiferae]